MKHTRVKTPVSNLAKSMLLLSLSLQSKVTALCNEKSLWRDTNQDPSLASIQEQRRDFHQRFQPYLDKLTPPEA